MIASMPLRTRFLLVYATCVAIVATTAAEIIGPNVGEQFPNPLQVLDQTGTPKDLAAVTGSKGVAIFFVRSADWCPFCKGQLVDVNRHLAEFNALGLNVVSVSVDEVKLIAEFHDAQHIGYTM